MNIVVSMSFAHGNRGCFNGHFYEK